jgi:hypothetical protein
MDCYKSFFLRDMTMMTMMIIVNDRHNHVEIRLE